MKIESSVLRAAIVPVSAALALAGASSTASAYVHGDPLTITAHSGVGDATFVLRVGDGTWNGDDWHYNQDMNTGLWASGVLLGTITHLTVDMYDDPQINLNFSMIGGSVPTKFTLNSALVGFPTIINATASASAGITITDNNGDGASLTGSLTGQTAYGADYNGNVPTGTTYTRLISSFGAAFSQTSNGNVGPNVLASVSDMSSMFSFTMSPFDSASGTSTYTIVPGPGGFALVGVGGLLVLRRRR